MKKSLLSLGVLAVVAIGFSMQSCDKVKDAVAKNVNYDGDVAVTKDTIIVDATNDTTTQFTTGDSPIPFNIDAVLREQTKAATGVEIGVDHISTAKLKSLKLTLLPPDATHGGYDIDNNFQNFELCAAYFYSDTHTQTTTVGEIDNNPNTYAITLDVPTNNVELKDYLHSTTFTWLMGAKLRKKTTHSLRVVVDATMTVHLQ